MTEGALEVRDSSPSLEIVDLKERKYQFHWTSIDRLESILQRGIYSPNFAKRISDHEFVNNKGKPVSGSEKNVCIMPTLSSAFDLVYLFGNMERIVGIALEVPQVWFVRHRIAPRQFRGLVVLDKRPFEAGLYTDFDKKILSISEKAEEYTNNRIGQIREIYQKHEGITKPLPIYGISGDLYFPQRISHEGIMEELRRKGEV